MATATRTRPARKAGGLETRTMLVNLTISAWSAGKYDRKVSQEIAEEHNADVTVGHYYKRLLGREALEKINRVYSAAYNDHIARTLPWSNSGPRILSTAAYLAYTERMRAYQSEFNEAVQEFLNNYDEYVEVAKERLNGLFNQDDYPSVRDLREKFGFRIQVGPLPTANDFRVDLSATEVNLIRQQIESENKETVERAMKEVVARIKGAVEHVAERLRAYNGTREGSFRDSLVTNVRELADILPSLNITNDPEINAIISKLQGDVCLHDAETLRKDEQAREATAQAADDILAKLSLFAA